MTVVEQTVGAQRELLAGNHGNCSGYKVTTEFGSARHPFTWLSDVGSEASNEALAAMLTESRLERKPLQFESWESRDEEWRMIFSGNVVVLYVEVDLRLEKVRALLQLA